jgi:Cft2 family RNA processing exonuclease
MQIFSGKGLFVGNVAIDAKAGCRPEKAIISHGHSDHVSMNSETNYVCTPETMALLEGMGKSKGNISGTSFGKGIAIGDSSVSLHNSGHILGSAQILVESGKTVAVTSDFKMQDSIIQKGAVPLKCDALVIETTFGQPCYSFPEREEVYQQIGSFVREKSKKGFVVLAGYALGKAQELTKAVNEYAGIVPLVHDSIFGNNRVYEQHGVKLGDYIELDHNLNESQVLIMPPSLLNRHLLQVLEFSLRKKVFSGMATGWQRRNGLDAVFPLSDHADFSQLLDYVKQAEPKLVVTMHGFEREFAGYVQRRLGIAARPLGEKGQKTIAEFA